jgi:uncharacterized membrane protein YkgB
MILVGAIIAGLLTLAFGAAGAMKLAKSRAELEPKMGPWVNDFSDAQVKGIGIVEIVLSVGLAVGLITKNASLLGWSAAALVFVMICAVLTLLRRGDGLGACIPALVLGALSAVVALAKLA